MFRDLLDLLTWRVQQPLIRAASNGFKSAASSVAQSVVSGARNFRANVRSGGFRGNMRSVVNAADRFRRSATETAHGMYDIFSSFSKGVLMDNKPLLYEIENPHFASWKRMGARRALTEDMQELYDKWSNVTSSGLFIDPPMPEKIVTFNPTLRKRMYAGMYAIAGLSAATAAMYHEDPRVPVSDITDPTIDYTQKNKRSMDYGTTGDYVLSSYYNQR